jgi:hypothetical protein
MFDFSTCYLLVYLCRVMIDSRHSCLEETGPSISCLMTFLVGAWNPALFLVHLCFFFFTPPTLEHELRTCLSALSLPCCFSLEN